MISGPVSPWLHPDYRAAVLVGPHILKQGSMDRKPRMLKAERACLKSAPFLCSLCFGIVTETAQLILSNLALCRCITQLSQANNEVVSSACF